MCGFAGIYSPSRPLAPTDIAIAQRVCERQTHRGPDASGYVITTHLALFHNKLSITTSARDSDQPFCWGDYYCAFAGEIYNHNALARNIGVDRGDFDGRVIPIGFAKAGRQFFAELEGEFALAVFDENDTTVSLARDRAGARNLYFAKTEGDCWVFSTELSALIRGTSINPELNGFAMLGQLLLQEWTPRLGTFFDNIFQVPPGTSVILSNRAPNIEAYLHECWDSDNRASVLANAVRNRLNHSRAAKGFIALSGGLDSTAIAALSATIAAPMPTFTVVSSMDDPIAIRILQLAEKMPWINPNAVILRSSEISDASLTELTEKLASPVCDTTPFAISALLQQASDQGFRYCLSGEGSDDLWAGYMAETPFLHQESIATAYRSLVDRVLESYSVEFLNGEFRKVPLIHQGAMEVLAKRIGDCITDISISAKAQTRQAPGRPLAVLSVLGPLRRSLEQMDCLAGVYSLEARVPYCSAGLMSLPWQAEWSEGKQWVRDMLPDGLKVEFDWTKMSFATRRFSDTALNDRLDDLVDEVLATPMIASCLDPTVEGSTLRMLARTNSKLWWSMIGIARFCTVYSRS